MGGTMRSSFVRTWGWAWVLVGCAAEVGASPEGIIGGAPSEPGRFPATGALFYEGVYEGEPVARVACSGTLIAPDVVVTAGHCLTPAIVDMVGLPRFTLDDDANAPGARYTRGARHVVHDGFDPVADPHIFLERADDVALLFLEAPIEGATPARLATPEHADAIVADLALDVVGYGQTDVDDTSTAGLERATTAHVVEVGDTELRHLGTGADCPGPSDSGGPIYADLGDGLRLVGVTSHGGGEVLDCNDGGDIAERVDRYAEWIAGEAPSVCDVTDLTSCPAPMTEGGCAATPARAPVPTWLAALGLLALRRRRDRAT